MDVEGGEEFKTTKQSQYRVLGCQECCISRRKKNQFRVESLSEPYNFGEGDGGACLRKNRNGK